MPDTRFDCRGVVAGIAATAVGACAGRSGWLNFDAVIQVDTPRGLVSGQSSLKALVNKGSALLPGDTGSTTFLGEAPFVDLGQGQIIVALLEAPYQKKILLDLMFDAVRGGHAEPPLEDAGNLWSDAIRLRPVVTFPVSGLPMFVTFGNTASPQTVRRVYPDGFAAAFGEGYALRDLRVVVTDGRNTQPPRILQALPWLDRPLETPLDTAYAGDGDLPLARTLYRTSFIKGRT